MEAVQVQTRSWSTRDLVAGFAAGAIAVLTVQQVSILLLNLAGIIPFHAWSTDPVPPFGVPAVLSGAFWGGLWGILYAWLEPRFMTGSPNWLRGAVFGVIGPALVLLAIVFPLKGIPFFAGFAPASIVLIAAIHAIFGLGLAVLYAPIARTLSRS